MYVLCNKWSYTVFIQISAHGGSRRQVKCTILSIHNIIIVYITGSTETWKDPQTKEK